MKNKSLVSLDLQGNKVGNDGATSLAKALAQNRSLMVLNLFAQQGGTRFGDSTLHAFADMFETNVTLLKITWRLDSRQSFRLTKMLTRNNDIDRRIKSDKEYPELLPAGVAPLSAELIAHRERASTVVNVGSTPRDSSSRASDRQSSFTSENGNSGRNSAREAPPPPPPAAPRATPAVLSTSSANVRSPEAGGASLEAALASLDAEYETKLKELKAAFDGRRKALIAGHKPVGIS